ncbi:MAG: T9SS type A sorting domain-containing protein [Bacteroidales bacterium]|nr:T9SS type A sorting domain-containing protein [Bacteroidales bacterium]
MKRTLLFMIALMIGVTVMAQLKPAKISKSLQNQAMPAAVIIDNQMIPSQSGNAIVNTKATLDDNLGASRYDMQTNGTIMNNRLLLWPDGSLSGTWTMGMADPNYTDRGTGYNYSDGTSWGAAPTSRIETMKAGWPSVHPWMEAGELVVCHNSTATLVMNSRPAKGTGAWTQSLAPHAPTGASGLSWPRTITNGDDHQNIHIIVMTTPTANGGTKYQNLDGAVIYYRSTDGGANWDKNGIILPGMSSPMYNGFSGDSYSWCEPKGDTIAFVIGDDWSDSFVMKSTDNGETWSKIMILDNPYKLTPVNTVTPSFPTCDGAIAGAMDKDGVVHVAFGRMRAKGDTDGKKYYPYTDGLVYWNTNMPVIDTTILTDLDSLDAHHLLIGYVVSNGNPNDTIVGFPKYYMSLSSFPQVTIDAYNNIYFFWSGLTVGNPSPDPYNYRHLWGRAWFNDKPEWTEMTDFNSNVLYMFQEYVYPSTAATLKNDKIQVIYQTSSQPGSNIKDSTIPIHDVNIDYREIPASDFWPVGIADPVAKTSSVSQNRPNPVNGVTSFDVNLTKAANVIVEVSNIMGQKIMSFDKGFVNSGLSTYTIDGNQLTSGIYFYTVKINGESYTHKMIVE